VPPRPIPRPRLSLSAGLRVELLLFGASEGVGIGDASDAVDCGMFEVGVLEAAAEDDVVIVRPVMLKSCETRYAGAPSVACR
jgi:hypothetical protein